jgi:alkylation response protein AidB-like acyl-CoA dehydrogenase
VTVVSPSAFRRQAETWFEEHAPKKGSDEDFSSAHIVSGTSVEEFQHNERRAFDMTRRWQRTLFDAQLAGRSWPTEYGGQAAPAWQDEVVAEVQSQYGVSTKMAAVALEMLPAVLFEHGTHQQRLTHLPAVLRGGEGWCQLLSEPDAGSDLGSVRTSAVPVADGWSVQGQKVWTSGAGCASFALLLARTEPDVAGTAGLSCLILDMSDPGVRVQPLRQMSGGYHFNEVFLDDVFVPAAALIGELGGGRAVLRTMLASERAAIGGGTNARSAHQLVGLVSRLGRHGEPQVRQAVAQAVVRERVLDLTVARLGAGGSIPSGGPVTKLLYSEHARLTADAALGLLGTAATVARGLDAEPWQDRFLFAPGLRLGGGTDEIQRTTIAERGLGLPREPAGPRGDTARG